MKDGRADIHDLAAVPIDLASQVVDQEIAVYPVGERDQRRNHLHTGPHGIDQIRTLIQPDVRFEYVIGRHNEPIVPGARPDIGTELQGAGGLYQPCDSGVVADTHLDSPAIPGGDIFPDTPFNMFIPTHYPEIR